jgi:hypothetical protein
MVALFRKGEIMEKLLVSSEEYNGRYVAVKSFDDNTIVGVGDDPERALNDAERKGFKNPVLFYTCPKGILCRSTNANPQLPFLNNKTR